MLLAFKAVAAELQIRVAWMRLDIADGGAARTAARNAFKLAQESEDLAVCSWAMAMSALLETWLGNTAAAIATVGPERGADPLAPTVMNESHGSFNLH
jgi:hypothetical protein